MFETQKGERDCHGMNESSHGWAAAASIRELIVSKTSIRIHATRNAFRVFPNYFIPTIVCLTYKDHDDYCIL
jgi:hypothetical protein